MKFTAENNWQYINSTWHLTGEVCPPIQNEHLRQFSRMKAITFQAFSCERNGCSLLDLRSLAGVSFQGGRGEEGFCLHTSQTVFSLHVFTLPQHTHNPCCLQSAAISSWFCHCWREPAAFHNNQEHSCIRLDIPLCFLEQIETAAHQQFESEGVYNTLVATARNIMCVIWKDNGGHCHHKLSLSRLCIYHFCLWVLPRDLRGCQREHCNHNTCQFLICY